MAYFGKASSGGGCNRGFFLGNGTPHEQDIAWKLRLQSESRGVLARYLKEKEEETRLATLKKREEASRKGTTGSQHASDISVYWTISSELPAGQGESNVGRALLRETKQRTKVGADLPPRHRAKYVAREVRDLHREAQQREKVWIELLSNEQQLKTAATQNLRQMENRISSLERDVERATASRSDYLRRTATPVFTGPRPKARRLQTRLQPARPHTSMGQSVKGRGTRPSTALGSVRPTSRSASIDTIG
mmetsp:Transcript_12273/g.26315  ORF Transcript_12273/g.26315 Transcript_12273/m.26315 type:complete len:249 (-) Transcript_12273:25-771(-)